MSKASRALNELQAMRAIASRLTDSSARSKLLGMINEVEHLVKGLKREIG
jgi:hypothetical protein